MNAERLLQHFERISETLDAIPSLRRFILNLAVRGKLVEQDSSDEPAAELLALTANVRAHLLAQGYPNQSEASAQLRKQSKQQVPQGLALLPSGWTWATLLQCSLFVVDCHNKTAPYAATGTPLIRTSNVRDGQLLLHDLKFVNDSTYARWSARCPPEPGDILITREAPMGEVCVIPDGMKVCLGQRMMLVRLGPGTIDSRFLLYSLRDPFLMERVQDKPVGATVQHLRVGGVETLLIPLPSLAEQHRIVVQVDELMALCDQLEAAKAEREQSRDRLVAASLHRLNSPADMAETDAPDLPARQVDAFRDHARFVFKHLPRLTTRPEHIKQLRQAILNLAVRGKLVSQDPYDEPVGELIRRVAAERQGLIAKGWLKAQKSCVVIDAATPMQPIPATWKWMRLVDLISFGPQNGISPKPTNNTESPKALTLTATTSGAFDASHYKHVDLREVDCQNYWLSAGDVLFQRGNTREYVGIAAVFDGPEKSFVFPDLMIRVRFAESLSLRFIHTTLISPLLRSYFSAEATGASSSMPKISQGVLLNAPIPLPPLPEQHRIVARVDELMALCDQLEAQLTTTEADSRRLLEAVLHEVLNPPLAATEQMQLEANA